MSSVFTSIMASFFSLILTFSSFLGFWAPPQVPELEPREVAEMMEISSDYVIVTSENQTAAEKTAAETLQRYLEEISGINFPIVFDSESYEREIIVGITNREGELYTVDRPALGNEGVVIKTVGDDIILTGGALRGTLYAVYTFLEDYLDCRWYTRDLTVIPEAENILIPAQIDYCHVPKLEFRDTSWANTRNKQWNIANKLNNRLVLGDESVGGGLGYAGSQSHSLTMGRLIAEEDFIQYPETMALGIESGVRTTEHPCLSSEKTFEIVLEGVFAWLNQYPDRQIVSVTQPDNVNYCVCDECKSVYEEEGSPAGLMLRFVNRLADEVAERYPDRDIAVDTFAYTYTRKKPSLTVPRDNVIVRLCSIEACFAHTIDDPDCERNVDFLKDLMDWSEICKRLYIWDYTTNYAHYNTPFNNWAVMKSNMQTFVEHGAVGVYEQGNSQSADSGGEFSDLRSYLLVKLLWDENADVKRHMIEFCNAFYGDAGEHVLRYLTLATEKTGAASTFSKAQHMGIADSAYRNRTMNFDVNDITYVDSLWEEARNLPDLSEEEVLRVRRSEISWRYWKASNQIREFNIFQRYNSHKQLHSDMMELGITRISESPGGDGNRGLLSESPDFMEYPGRWSRGRVSN